MQLSVFPSDLDLRVPKGEFMILKRTTRKPIYHTIHDDEYDEYRGR